MATNTAGLQQSQQSKLMGIFTAFFILPVIIVSLRFLSRRLTRMDIWWDDCLILVATVILTTNYAFLIKAIHYGGGKHVETVTDPEHLKTFLIYTYGNELIYASIVTSVKGSILCMYLRIFSINKTFAKLVYTLIVLVICWGIAVFFSTVFQCHPIEAAWIPTLPGGQCFNYHDWLIWTNVPNIIIDGCILVLPIPLVWALQLSVPRKVSLSGVFLLGGFTIVCSIIRVKVNSEINLADPTWSYVPNMIWSTIEGNVGVICACLPILVPVLRVFTGRFRVTSSSSKGQSIRVHKRSSRLRPSDLEDLSSFARLEEDTTRSFPIRKIVRMETVAADSGINMDTFDVRRPGDT